MHATSQSNLLSETLMALNEIMDRGVKIITWDSLHLEEYIELCKKVSCADYLVFETKTGPS